jgi:hypothetical protein
MAAIVLSLLLLLVACAADPADTLYQVRPEAYVDRAARPAHAGLATSGAGVSKPSFTADATGTLQLAPVVSAERSVFPTNISAIYKGAAALACQAAHALPAALSVWRAVCARRPPCDAAPLAAGTWHAERNTTVASDSGDLEATAGNLVFRLNSTATNVSALHSVEVGVCIAPPCAASSRRARARGRQGSVLLRGAAKGLMDNAKMLLPLFGMYNATSGEALLFTALPTAEDLASTFTASADEGCVDACSRALLTPRAALHIRELNEMLEGIVARFGSKHRENNAKACVACRSLRRRCVPTPHAQSTQQLRGAVLPARHAAFAGTRQSRHTRQPVRESAARRCGWARGWRL